LCLGAAVITNFGYVLCGGGRIQWPPLTDGSAMGKWPAPSLISLRHQELRSPPLYGRRMPSGQCRAREARFARLAFDICDGGHNVFARIAGDDDRPFVVVP